MKSHALGFRSETLRSTSKRDLEVIIMFAPATQPQQQQPQPQQQKQSETVSSAGEEALKWNTDCVYFLASPLTCKKVIDFDVCFV